MSTSIEKSNPVNDDTDKHTDDQSTSLLPKAKNACP